MEKNFLLDVDGTLWDTTEVVAGAWNRAVQADGFPCGKITASMLTQLFGKPMDSIALALFPEADAERRARLLERCCRYEHADLLACSEDLLYPTVRETIAALSETHRLFIVSNCQSGYIELFLEKAGLSQYITDFECYGNTGKSKSENIRLVAERNGLESPVYVGDTEGDREAARGAGISFIHAAYGFGRVSECDRAIHCFAELLHL